MPCKQFLHERCWLEIFVPITSMKLVAVRAVQVLWERHVPAKCIADNFQTMLLMVLCNTTGVSRFRLVKLSAKPMAVAARNGASHCQSWWKSVEHFLCQKLMAKIGASAFWWREGWHLSIAKMHLEILELYFGRREFGKMMTVSWAKKFGQRFGRQRGFKCK